MSLGLAVGTGLLASGYQALGIGFMAGGVVVSLLLVAAPIAADAASTGFVRRAYRQQGLTWPPADQQLANDRREAAQHVSVELENNAGQIGIHLDEDRYWNTKANPLVADTFHRYSSALSRDLTIAALYRRIGSLYNEKNAVNQRVFRQWSRQRRQPEAERGISDDDRRNLRRLRGRLDDARRELAEYADNL